MEEYQNKAIVEQGACAAKDFNTPSQIVDEHMERPSTNSLRDNECFPDSVHADKPDTHNAEVGLTDQFLHTSDDSTSSDDESIDAVFETVKKEMELRKQNVITPTDTSETVFEVSGLSHESKEFLNVEESMTEFSDKCKDGPQIESVTTTLLDEYEEDSAINNSLVAECRLLDDLQSMLPFLQDLYANMEGLEFEDKQRNDSTASDCSQTIESKESYPKPKYADITFFSRDNTSSARRREFTARFRNITDRISKISSEVNSKDGTNPSGSTFTECLKQRDRVISKLKSDVASYETRLEHKSQTIRELCATKQDQIWKRVLEAEEENNKLRAELDNLREENMILRQELDTKSQLLQRIQKEFDADKKSNQEMFLKMYEKGRNTAWIERQEQIEELLEQTPAKISNTDLLVRLQRTEEELRRWQSMAQEKSYNTAYTSFDLRTQTQADAVLGFMKDSMLHYLTDTDKEERTLHLRAMLRMLGFSEEEKALVERPNRSGSKKKGK